MNLFHAEEMAEDVLADLVVDEISNLENEHLTFRLVYITIMDNLFGLLTK